MLNKLQNNYEITIRESEYLPSGSGITIIALISSFACCVKIERLIIVLQYDSLDYNNNV